MLFFSIFIRHGLDLDNGIYPELLISYINETNKIYLNTEQIEYFNLKQNIKNKETKCINELSDFFNKCNENLDIKENKKEIKYQKIKIKNKNNKDNRSIISKRDNKNKNKSQNKFDICHNKKGLYDDATLFLS